MTSASAIPESPEITDLIEAQAIFERSPVEELIDKHVMVNGQWVVKPYYLMRGPCGLSDRPAREQEQTR